MNPPARPSGVLLMSNDMATPFAKTTDFLAAAVERRGVPPTCATARRRAT